jgi:hypothetical protein
MATKVIVLRVANGQELKLQNIWAKIAMGQEGEIYRDAKRRFIYDQARKLHFVLQGQAAISQYIIVVPTDANQGFNNKKAPCVLAFFTSNGYQLAKLRKDVGGDTSKEIPYMRNTGAVQTFLLPFEEITPYLVTAIKKYCTTPFQIDDEEVVKKMLDVCQKKAGHKRGHVECDFGYTLLKLVRQYRARKEEESSSRATALQAYTKRTSTSSSPPSTTSLPSASTMQTRSQRAAMMRSPPAVNSPPEMDLVSAIPVCSKEGQSNSDSTLSMPSQTPSPPSD